jgi:spore germination protein YaaH
MTSNFKIKKIFLQLINSLSSCIMQAACILLLVIPCLISSTGFSQSLSKGKPAASKYSVAIDSMKLQSDTLVWAMDRYLPEKIGAGYNQTLFKKIHGAQQQNSFTEARAFKTLTYDTINNLYYGILRNTNRPRPDVEVFGWHPYWMEETYKYYPYSLLTKIAFFAYDVNADGTYIDLDAIQSWKTNSMIDSAQKNNVGVLLSVTSYGKDRNKKFLENKEAWITLGDSLVNLLQLRHAQGIDIDFSGIQKEQKNNFTAFVKTLRSKLGDACFISLHITSTDLRNLVFDLNALKSEAKIDKFIIQGFDYEEVPTHRRSMAPLFSNQHDVHCIAHTVQYCLQNGLNEKDLILNLPLFGTIWYGREFKEMPYSDIVSLYEKNYLSHLDLISESAFIHVNKQMDTVIWYESAESMYLKFEWAKVHGLSGVGLWGLGYDGGQPEVWNAVAANFGMDPVTQAYPLSIDYGKSYSFMYALQKYRKHIGVGIFILIVFITAGILFSLLDWRVREVFFRNYLYRILLSFLLLVLVMTSLFCYFENSGGIFSFMFGSIAGGVLIYLITKSSIKNRNQMP